MISSTSNNVTQNLPHIVNDLMEKENYITRMPLIDDLTSTVIHNNRGISTNFIQNYSDIIEYLQTETFENRRDPLYIVLPITVIYAVIFLTGIVGNVSTCVVIARNKSMHTATNYYLFSLAISDLLLLISGLPPEMYYIWSQYPYIFGEVFCIIQSFAAETSANATVLTITAFTVERYVAICHPFISHTMSKLSRAVKFVVVIWLLALCLAVPQAIQFGIVYEYYNETKIMDSARCSTKWTLIKHAFEIHTMLFFVLPMTIITVLYILIAVKLRKSRVLTASTKRHQPSGSLNHCDSGRGKNAAQRNVIRMLVAVVVAFFICWAPFHAQRLLAVYAQGREPHAALVIVYTTLTYVSGVFYYLSTTVNPLLYNIMSNKFREAFKSMLSKQCGRKWSSRSQNSVRQSEFSASKYQRYRSMRRFDNEHRNSASLSASEENQRLTSIGGVGEPPYSNELNEFGSQKERPVPLVPQSTKPEVTDRRDYFRSLSRGSSNSSQLTVITSMSKTVSEVNNKSSNQCLLKIQRPPKAITLAGLLAERLRFGTKELFASQRRASLKPDVKTDAKLEIKSEIKPDAGPITPRFRSHPSIESANTISNSSLQDLDETEFTGTELARYMGEVNCDLVT